MGLVVVEAAGGIVLEMGEGVSEVEADILADLVGEHGREAVFLDGSAQGQARG